MTAQNQAVVTRGKPVVTTAQLHSPYKWLGFAAKNIKSIRGGDAGYFVPVARHSRDHPAPQLRCALPSTIVPGLTAPTLRDWLAHSTPNITPASCLKYSPFQGAQRRKIQRRNIAKIRTSVTRKNHPYHLLTKPVSQTLYSYRFIYAHIWILSVKHSIQKTLQWTVNTPKKIIGCIRITADIQTVPIASVTTYAKELHSLHYNYLHIFRYVRTRLRRVKKCFALTKPKTKRTHKNGYESKTNTKNGKSLKYKTTNNKHENMHYKNNRTSKLCNFINSMTK